MFSEMSEDMNINDMLTYVCEQRTEVLQKECNDIVDQLLGRLDSRQEISAAKLELDTAISDMHDMDHDHVESQGQIDYNIVLHTLIFLRDLVEELAAENEPAASGDEAAS